MPAPTTTRLRRGAVALLCSALAGTLAACGGGNDGAPAVAGVASTADTALFDAQGRALPSPRALLPASTAARTRSGLYATRAQLAWQEQVAAPSTILIDLDANGSVAAAVLLAEQVRGWRGTQGLAFYVRGRDAATVAEVVDRLVDAGFGTVFAVV